MTMYFMRETLEDEDIEEIKDCLQSIRDKLYYVKEQITKYIF
jgi:hypothetical protein